jgi:enoyl-CoA hydratase
MRMGKWLNDPQLITFEVKDKVAYITLNRPEKRNALSLALLNEFQAALMEADDRKDIRCAVLQGAGKDFCAGYDLGGGGSYLTTGDKDFDASQYRGNASYDDDIWQLRVRGQSRMLAFDMFKPLLCKVHGNCLAGGTDLALMCDIVIAADDARIGFPATRALGSPANHMWLYHAGPQWAKRLLFTGDSIRGRDAAKVGLVLKAVPKEKLDAEVAHLAKRISNVEADLLAAHKRIVNLGMELMGTRTLQRLAGENDGRAHLSPAFTGFVTNLKEKGLKEALRIRDEPFGKGDASLDPEV